MPSATSVSVLRKFYQSLFAALACSVLFVTITYSAPLMKTNHIGALSAVFGGRHVVRWEEAGAPTDAECRAKKGVPCYSPQEMRNAYDLTPVLNAGYVGKGQSIVIIDSFGSPTALADLKQFDT